MTRMKTYPDRQQGKARVVWMSLLVTVSLVVAAVIAWNSSPTMQHKLELKTSEALGELASQFMQQRSNKFAPVPDAIEHVTPDIYRIGGVGHTQLVKTAAGNVVFDTGLSLQSAKQMRLLKESAPGRTTHIILSHSHADHVGGTRFWREPEALVVAHREFPEEQRYLTELQPYLHGRNRAMFPWLPEKLPDSGLTRYGGIEPEVLVEVDQSYQFEQGGYTFEVIATPGGAEGADNLVMWLPEHKILFTGDTLGPMFPQFPNIVTLRGEKIRKPAEYIKTLNLLITLEPEVLIPSHNPVVRGGKEILQGLTRIRDAVQYVHDATVAGMNAGKTLHQLMAEISLPPDLALTQSHGKISWAVKSLWEYYATWFYFESTTELYPVSVRDVYPDLAALAGTPSLVAQASKQLQDNKAVHALHLVEIALAAEPSSTQALRVRLNALNMLLDQAENGLRVDYEMYYLKQRIELTEELLQDLGT